MTISLRDIQFKFGGKVVLERLSYHFTEGIYLISGESGSGKTTLLNLIKGFVHADTGEMERTGSISYMMQETMLFSNLTVLENYSLKYALYHEMNLEECKAMLLQEMKLIGLPEDLLTMKVSSLSGGQKRKLEVLLISCDSSDVILLDEPVANLDKVSIQQMATYIENHWSDEKTVIISSHSEIVFKGQVQRLVLEEKKLRSAH
ncbi:ATP-binding cassette domain-containing protein [Paenibacillus barcinonensis]|uniref:ATP-binding cassette domain-containing protein n=1 Tax=Paenibacillus barcinonensis TaxID=198119 RepID=A0A2V4V4W8_PAEBA|nr:ATP-binding cassette domain-containing protein [Paenibacillus barcinonensis]PYE47333.1 carbohydrate ABC transporter ATP-binding protein (CUT1 family) [Paenibacillus barcinonensis]QKS58230.1 ATP-binding cassette domain-containing protein [Paenibacillus barcinonensis]